MGDIDLLRCRSVSGSSRRVGSTIGQVTVGVLADFVDGQGEDGGTKSVSMR